MSELEHRESIERDNLEDRLEIERSVEKMRSDLISSVFKGVKNYWKLQDEKFDEIAVAGYPEDAAFEYYVVPTFTGFPFEDGEPVLSLSLFLTPEASEVSDEEVVANHSSMAVFVPLPAGTIVNENLNVDELPEPTEVAIVYTTPSGLPMNFRIDITGTSPFVSAVDSGDQEQAIELGEMDEEIQKLVDGKVRIREDIEIIPRLFKAWVEWKAQVQRTIPVREMGKEG